MREPEDWTENSLLRAGRRFTRVARRETSVATLPIMVADLASNVEVEEFLLNDGGLCQQGRVPFSK